MSTIISAIGTTVPEHSIAQSTAGQGTGIFCCQTESQHRLVEGLFRRSGVLNRHSVLLEKSAGTLAECQSFYQSPASATDLGPTTAERMTRYEAAAGDLAIAAAQQACERSGISPRQVTHLVTVTCTGFSAPGFDADLIRDLPLRPTVARTQIGFMGCHAALNALRVARSFVASDPQAVVLICCVELCSLHFQFGWDPEQIVATSLFADGAGACVVQAGEANAGQLQVLSHGSLLLPDYRDAMSWRLTDYGFKMTLSPTVPALLEQHLLPWVTEWLGNQGYRPDEIGSWAVHPGGPRILQAFTDAMRLSPASVQTSRDILSRYGNMSSPTLLFILDVLMRKQANRPIVALGFGPGLAIEATLLG